MPVELSNYIENLINMKRIISIILLTSFVFITKAADYYISPSGSNSSGTGSQSNPWATLDYAISRVTTPGDNIRVMAGNYPAISVQMELAQKVSIIGAGRDVTTITMTNTSGGGCIKMESYGQWTNKTIGFQSISGIKFVGSTTPGTPVGLIAIVMYYRNHVYIHDCEFIDFVRSAVRFNGQQYWSGFNIDNPYYNGSKSDMLYIPFNNSFAEGNRFYNNIVHNCCGRIGTTDDFSGALEVSVCDGCLVYGNYMTATGRPGNDNGVPIKFIGAGSGFNRNSKIYNNHIIVGHMNTNHWQFAIEIWWDLGGTEVYNNTCEGAIDLCDSWDQYGAGYGIRCYNNDIGYSQNTTNLDRGILFEGTHVDTYVYNNHIHHVARAITHNNNNNSNATIYNNVHVYNNYAHHLSGRDYQTWGMYWDPAVTSQGGLFQNIFIRHNTFHASEDAPGTTMHGIMIPSVTELDSWYLENNIIMNFEYSPIFGSGARDQATNIFMRNNLIYGCGNNNNPVYQSSFPTAGVTFSGTVKSNPLFVSISSQDFHVQSTSPAINAGRPISEITTDYDGVARSSTTPTIGAYEFTQAAATYYVKNGGNDNADGLSDATAWATINKVNNQTFAAGTTILFKRDNIWREEVSLIPDVGGNNRYVTYGAYGTGNKPKLLGSTLENSTSDWTVYSGNVWQNNDASFSNVNVGNLIFNNEELYGIYKTSLSAVTSQGDFFFDVNNRRLYLYSISNPATYYSNIECALDRPIVNFGSNKGYIILENLDFRYTAGHGTSAYNGSNNIIIRDCDFSFIGGGYFEDGAARYGNAIQFWQSSSDIIIERCTFDNIYDAAITAQYAGTGSQTCNITNWHARNNLINRSEYSFEFFTSRCVGNLSGIYFQNNTCRNAGGGFGHEQRPDSKNGRHVVVWNIVATTRSDIWIRNNIFDNATESAIRVGSEALNYINFDYNLYNVATVAYTGNTYATLQAWRNFRNDENNSLSGNPNLVSTEDWHLTSTSPVIGKGYNVGYDTDFDKQSWNSPPSIGAYEYDNIPGPGPDPGIGETKVGLWNGKRGMFNGKTGKW